MKLQFRQCVLLCGEKEEWGSRLRVHVHSSPKGRRREKDLQHGPLRASRYGCRRGRRSRILASAALLFCAGPATDENRRATEHLPGSPPRRNSAPPGTTSSAREQQSVRDDMPARIPVRAMAPRECRRECRTQMFPEWMNRFDRPRTPPGAPRGEVLFFKSFCSRALRP